MAMLLVLCLLPMPLAFAEEEVTNNYHYTYITGGKNEQGYSDETMVNTSVTNITSENTTVYVYGDYNPEYLYRPVVSELHMRNHAAGALWDPKLEELPNSLRAFVMDKAGIAILYDGYVDLEWAGDNKPYGASREGEVLGYDIYAKLGEAYTYAEGSNAYSYVSTGLYSKEDPVNVSWALMQLYRAVGEELVQFYVTTESRSASEYDINASPLVQFVSMATDGVDLSKVISNVYASRTDIDTYWRRAQTDHLGIFKATDPEQQYLTVGDFCELAYKLMYIYGEPVLTDQEIALLMQVYGRDLPYGLNSIQLEAVKHLMARGILDSDLDWYGNITFEDAATILMRIKDKDSRLTFKDIQLTLDVGLLANGYYPVEVTSQTAPIEILGKLKVDATTYPYYDYFIEFTPETRFKTVNGFYSIPFIGAGPNNTDGVLQDSSYVGTYGQAGRTFYHFVVRRDKPDDDSGIQYLNTAVEKDTPYRYDLGQGYKAGGYFLQGENGWTRYAFDEGPLVFPSQYVDAGRLGVATQTSTSQMALFNESQYGISFRVLTSKRGDVEVTLQDGTQKTLVQIGTSKESLANGYSIQQSSASTSGLYTTYTVGGLQSSAALSSVLIMKEGSGTAYQSYPAIAKQNEQYLVPVELLQEMGVVWSFEKLGDGYYYLGVKSIPSEYNVTSGQITDPYYTDVFINTGEGGNAPYAIKGTQMKIYDEDVALVVEQDSTYYIDYSTVLGITSLVGFELSGGKMSLTNSGLPSGVKVSQIRTTRNLAGDTTLGEPLATYTQYIYCPITYSLANWICTEEPSGTRRMFTFWAGYDGDEMAATALKELVGIELPEGWVCYKTDVKPKDNMATLENLPPYPGYGEVYYVEECGAFLIPIQSFTSNSPYSAFANNPKAGDYNRLTSIANLDGILYDLNFNSHYLGERRRSSTIVRCGEVYKDIASVPLAHGSSGGTVVEVNSTGTIAAPAGVPGLLGNPAAHTYQSASDSTRVYQGVYPFATGSTQTIGQGTSTYAIIHSTPTCTWYQSNTFTFTFTPGGLLSNATTDDHYTVDAGDAASTFDWASFFQSQKLLDADNVLSVLIILVLNILPRILTAFCILLIGLATISMVKPWQSFCDNVFDPYKALTFGRKDVHTIKVKSTVFFSILALAFFGLCQNGTIIDIIAWVARGVAGILNR